MVFNFLGFIEVTELNRMTFGGLVLSFFRSLYRLMDSLRKIIDFVIVRYTNGR